LGRAHPAYYLSLEFSQPEASPACHEPPMVVHDSMVAHDRHGLLQILVVSKGSLSLRTDVVCANVASR